MPWNHHRLVARFSDNPEYQRELLENAATCGWSLATFRKLIKKAHPEAPATPEKGKLTLEELQAVHQLAKARRITCDESKGAIIREYLLRPVVLEEVEKDAVARVSAKCRPSQKKESRRTWSRRPSDVVDRIPCLVKWGKTGVEEKGFLELKADNGLAEEKEALPPVYKALAGLPLYAKASLCHSGKCSSRAMWPGYGPATVPCQPPAGTVAGILRHWPMSSAVPAYRPLARVMRPFPQTPAT